MKETSASSSVQQQTEQNTSTICFYSSEKVTRKEDKKKVLFNYSVLICRVFFLFKTQINTPNVVFLSRQLLMTTVCVVKPNRIADEEARAL